MTQRIAGLLIAAVALLAGCDSSSSLTCSLQGGTTLAPTTWPKFRADLGNTGRAAVDLTGSEGGGGLLFQGVCSIATTQTCTDDEDCLAGECNPIGPISTTPILDPQTPSPNIYLGSSDGNVYAVTAQGDMLPLNQPIQITSAIVGSPLLGADGTLFVAGNSLLAQFETTGDFPGTQTAIAGVPGFVSASPNIWNGDGTVDGTVFVGTESNVFTGICPNNVARWSSTFPATQSSAALVADPNVSDQVTPIIVVGGLNGQVRAYNIRGRHVWSFLATASIAAAILIDPSTNLVYIADTAGRVFVLNVANGQPTAPPFTAAAGITASPALGRDGTGTPTIYVGDQSGVLYALDRTTLERRWCFPDPECPKRRCDPMEDTCVAINSSPAVATGGTQDVIVFGADILAKPDPTAAPVAIDGMVYALRDDGESASVLWTFDGVGHSIGAASPSIGIDKTVYIGREGNRLGTPDECPTVDRNSDGIEDACVINDGGGLYAICALDTPAPCQP